jgi:hypothetical protein
MRTQHLVVRAASSPSRPKRDGLEYPAEAQLLRRTDARSIGSRCTDAFRPVTFLIEPLDETPALPAKKE